MDDSIEKKIVEHYQNGLSSIKISEIVGLSKKTILKILNRKGIVRKRDRCDKLKYEFNGNQFILQRECPTCHRIILTKSKDRTICCRNHLNKIGNKINCKACSLELQKGEGNPFYGKKHKKTTKVKISLSRKDKATKENNPMANPIYRERAKNNLIKRWESGELEETRKLLSNKMKETIKNGKIKSFITSKAEYEIKNTIENLGYFVEHSFRVESKICDLYIPELNLVIEYNGDYWHCNPKKYKETFYNRKKKKFASEIWDYDKSKLELLTNLNYNLHVIWESDYKSDPSIIQNIIKKYAKS